MVQTHFLAFFFLLEGHSLFFHISEKCNHFKERLLNQAQAQAPYSPPPPPLGGHLHGIPQCMLSDVQPFVKSLFWETRLSTNEFLILTPLPPQYLGTAFGRGVGVGGQNLVGLQPPLCVDSDPYPVPLFPSVWTP